MIKTKKIIELCESLIKNIDWSINDIRIKKELKWFKKVFKKELKKNGKT